MKINKDHIQPSGIRMLVEIYKADTETDAGIEVVSSAANSAPVMGTVVRAGRASKFAAGTRVMFRRYAIDELKIQTPEGEEVVFFIEDTDVLATVDDGETLEDTAIRYPQIAAKRDADQTLHEPNGTSEESKEGEEEQGSSAEASAEKVA